MTISFVGERKLISLVNQCQWHNLIFVLKIVFIQQNFVDLVYEKEVTKLFTNYERTNIKWLKSIHEEQLVYPKSSTIKKNFKNLIRGLVFDR